MLELNLIACVLKQRSLFEVHQAGIKLEHLNSDVRPLWSFIEDHFAKFSATPSTPFFLEKFPIELPVVEEGIDVWIQEIVKRETLHSCVRLIPELEQKLKVSDPSGFIEIAEQFLVRQRNSFSQLQVSTVESLIPSTIQRYLDAEAGVTGIPTPWPSLTSITRGWWKKDVNYLCARPGVGKSWASIFMVFAAVRAGVKTLLISGELDRQNMADRYISIEGKFPYEKVKEGTLSTEDRTRFLCMKDDLNSSHCLTIIDGQFGMKSEDVEKVIARSDSEFIVIDAAYLISAKQKTRDRSENMACISTELKRYAMMYNKAIVATVQLNRAATTKKNYDDSDVALSDSIGQTATNLFAMKQDDENRKQNVMEIHGLKTRESKRPDRPIQIRWDFERMEFEDLNPITGEELDKMPMQQSIADFLDHV